MTMLITKSTCNWKCLQSGLLILFVTLIAGCGFQLKQTAAIPADFGPVNISGISSYSSLYRNMRNALRQSSIEVVSDAATANHSIVINNAKDERRVLSVNADGKVAEYELIKSLTFSVKDNSGNTLTNPQTLSVNRFYTASDSDALSNNSEEDDLKLRMEDTLVDRMLRIISSRI